MTDECMNCSLRGDLKSCSQAECHQHENWYAIQLVELSKELVRKIKNISEGQIKVMISEQPVSFDWVDADDYFSELLEKAKELTND